MQNPFPNVNFIPHIFFKRRPTGTIAEPSQPSSSDDEFEEDRPIRHYEPQDFEDVSFGSDDEISEDKIHSMDFFHTNFNIPPANNPLSISSPIDYQFFPQIQNPASYVNTQIVVKRNKFVVSSHVPVSILKYLERLQIFPYEREESNEWSLLWALKQYGLPYYIINNVQSKYSHMNMHVLSDICEQYSITIKVHRYNKDWKKKIKLAGFQRSGVRYFYIGLDPKISNTIIDLFYYKDHYFLMEKTPFSLRYLDSFAERFLNDKKKVNSLELILKLEEKGLIQ